MFIYHRDIGFPSSLVISDELRVTLDLTRHAKERLKRDRFNTILTIPTWVKITKDNVVELYTQNNKKINKILMRISYDKKRDLVMVIQPFFNLKKANVITWWINNKDDQHNNLDMTKYTNPNEPKTRND